MIPIAKPYVGKEEMDAVVKVLKENQLSSGSNVKEFEEKFANYIGTKYACSVSSGTAGLHLCVKGFDLKDGDEVITSPFSFISSANAILFERAKPVFVDIDEKTLNMDLDQIEDKITKKTKAILAVHIFGHPLNMDKLNRIADKYNLKVIEDACESLGAKYKDKKLGNFGNPTVFAFYPNKQMTTGEGGMIVTDDKKQYELYKSLSNQGRGNDMQWLSHDKLGYNYRMDGFSCALGIEQLKKINFLIEERNKVADKYNFLLKNVDGISVLEQDKYAERSWFVYVVKFDKEINRNRVIEEMQKRGISTKNYFPTIHLHSFYKKMFGYKEGDFPVCEKVSKSTIALPFYIELTNKEISLVCKSLKEVIIGLRNNEKFI